MALRQTLMCELHVEKGALAEAHKAAQVRSARACAAQCLGLPGTDVAFQMACEAAEKGIEPRVTDPRSSCAFAVRWPRLNEAVPRPQDMEVVALKGRVAEILRRQVASCALATQHRMLRCWLWVPGQGT
eukprot:2277002-Rhodomonas_salina.2